MTPKVNRKHYFIGLTLLMLCVSMAEAQLVWRKAEQQRSVGVEQASTSFVFHFRNAGEEPVKIVKVRKSCGCLSTEFDERLYAPGESGSLKVAMDLQGRSGPLQKSLMVTTSNQPNGPKKLRVKVNVPKGYELSTRRLIWEASDSTPQTCRLTNSSSTPVILESVRSSDSAFTVELIEIREGFEYEVIIQPVTESGTARSIVSIFTSSPKAGVNPRSYSISVLRKGG